MDSTGLATKGCFKKKGQTNERGEKKKLCETRDKNKNKKKA